MCVPQLLPPQEDTSGRREEDSHVDNQDDDGDV